MDGRMAGWIGHGREGGWMDGWEGGWVYGWTGGWVYMDGCPFTNRMSNSNRAMMAYNPRNDGHHSRRLYIRNNNCDSRVY